MRVHSLEEKEQEQLYKYLSYKMRIIYQLGCKTGLRISDIIKLQKRILNIKEPTIKEQKTGKSKRFYLSKDVRLELKKIAEKSPNEYIFGTKNKQGYITRQAVYKAFKKAAAKADIKTNIGTHSMRKNYALKIANKHNLKYVQNKLNHDNLNNTLIYALDKELK